MSNTDKHTKQNLDPEFQELEDYFCSLPPENPLSIHQSSITALSSKKRFTVKGNGVCLTPERQKEIIEKWPTKKKYLAYHLALALNDKYNLAWYKKIARERRSDLLKNCLIKTYEAFNKNMIKTTLARYFTGVLKNRTRELKRLEEYKKRTYKHTT